MPERKKYGMLYKMRSGRFRSRLRAAADLLGNGRRRECQIRRSIRNRRNGRMTVWERAVAALAARALDGGLLDSLRGESLSALSPEDAAARKARREGVYKRGRL